MQYCNTMETIKAQNSPSSNKPLIEHKNKILREMEYTLSQVHYLNCIVKDCGKLMPNNTALHRIVLVILELTQHDGLTSNKRSWYSIVYKGLDNQQHVYSMLFLGEI